MDVPQPNRFITPAAVRAGTDGVVMVALQFGHKSMTKRFYGMLNGTAPLENKTAPAGGDHARVSVFPTRHRQSVSVAPS